MGEDACIDHAGKAVGFLGWGFAGEADAAAWLEGCTGFSVERALAGDCIIINAWAADTAEVNGLLLDAARKAARGKRFACFKRFYTDGSIRRARLPINSLFRRACDARRQQ